MNRLGILVAGGPAPGINGVISGAVIEARKANMEVFGFYNGWKWLTKGEARYKTLQIRHVSRIHNKGGSILRTSREGFLGDPKQMQKATQKLLELDVKQLIVIGGDGTAYSSYLLSRQVPEIQVVHVPKTIDNDLPLPGTISTFGFQTARHKGSEIVFDLMEDAATVGRWYFVVTMGRKTGHLALGIGKSSGATLTIIPEEFPHPKIRLSQIADILETSILKRLAMGNEHGVALLAEGLLAKLEEEDLSQFGKLEKDPSGHIRFSALNIGMVLKREVERRLKEKGMSLTIVSKNLGYELRSTSPIPFDQEYTRTLGYGAFSLLQKGYSGVLVTLQNQKLVPIPLETLLDADGKRIRIRYVDISTETYRVAREYMIRLEKRDIEEEEMLERLCK
ncbi:MAG: 6-phosphofructokinase, partial [Planctomycetota bacterium]